MLYFPYEHKGLVNNAYCCALLLPISVYCCYRFLCTQFTIFCALVVSVYITETKLSELYDSLYVHYGVNISDEDKQKILTFGDLKHEYTACRNSLLSTSPRLNIDIEDFYDFILDELGYSENENIGPYYRFIEDLGCDSLEVFELCMSIEEEYDIEISEDITRMFMYNIVEIYNYLTGKDL